VPSLEEHVCVKESTWWDGKTRTGGGCL
jgi:hypothetical protein